ncbi:hypothetical protein GTQ34_11980 [Muricauda sp. JGD-17]|uniref:Fibronectin type-III domain-containing protein n=1 Tax=Flagellimonas ochracea TaxID=2696472 RepID=A0A964TD05_9FLAO|nr:hypothetical protein [Allomuricauda ochracea]NAY92637.1 hypothetical protein [Allomuricauda ochracea]
MKNPERYKIPIILQLFCLLLSCSSGDDNTAPPPTNQNPPPVNQTNLPGKAVGELPENGEPCSDYEEVTGDDTKVSVAFSWSAAQFADNYILVINEGSNEVFRNTFVSRGIRVVLDRGKTFTWRVISANEDGQTNGDTYSFTTPGTPVGNFAPYAAEITVAFNQASSEMVISWIGNDEDGDELTYDARVFEESELFYESFDLIETTIPPLAFVPFATYAVEVVSRDTFGNFSVSRVSFISSE